MEGSVQELALEQRTLLANPCITPGHLALPIKIRLRLADDSHWIIIRQSELAATREKRPIARMMVPLILTINRPADCSNESSVSGFLVWIIRIFLGGYFGGVTY